MVAVAGGLLSRVGRALAVVGSVVGVIAGVAEIIRELRYISGAGLIRGDSDDDDDDAGEGGDDALDGSGRELAAVGSGGPGAPVSIRMKNSLVCGRTRSDHWHGKQRRENSRGGIQFENLPEDVLCTIFSKLQLKEAARTSILSSRWRRMWTLYPKLRFDSNTMCGQDICGAQQCTQKFIDNVNGVLQQLHGKEVETLEIKFEFDMMLVDHLNNWISFAVSSSTKSLAFDLVPEKFRGRDDRYAFPFELLNSESTLHLQSIQLSFVSFKPPSEFSGFPNLRRLDLHILNVSAKDLQEMLSSCPRLEWLSIVRCHLSDELKLDHPFPHLQYLQVAYCRIEKIELHAAKLKTFIYRGWKLPIDLRQCQELETACLFHLDMTLEYALTGLPCLLPSVRNLTLHAHIPLETPWLLEKPGRFSQLKYLQLEVFFDFEYSDNIVSLASFLQAAPYIESLDMHFNPSSLVDVASGPPGNLPRCPHNHLKSLRITGFKGIKGQVEFLLHTVENAPALEILTIDPATRMKRPYMFDFSWSSAREVAKRYLVGKLAPNTKLHVL